AKVFPRQKCRIRPDAFPDRIYYGEISRVMPIADRSQGALPLRVKVFVPKGEEEGQFLKPEMSVLVSFLRPAGHAGAAAERGGQPALRPEPPGPPPADTRRKPE